MTDQELAKLESLANQPALKQLREENHQLRAVLSDKVQENAQVNLLAWSVDAIRKLALSRWKRMLEKGRWATNDVTVTVDAKEFNRFERELGSLSFDRQLHAVVIGGPDSSKAFEVELQQTARLADALDWALRVIDHDVNPPTPSHIGSCGPWANCDGDCADAVYFAQALARARKALTEARSLQ